MILITRHAQRQAEAKGFPERDLALAVAQPDYSYPSRNHPGQQRFVRGDLCVVAAPIPAGFSVITCYLNRVQTPLRPDQTDG